MMHSNFRFALAFTLAALGAAANAAFAQTGQTDSGSIEMSAPLNGWRNSAGDDSRYTQDVHYPAVSVSTPQGQGAASMIAGRIRNTPKAAASTDESKPRRRRGADGSSVGTLVVNGVAMPQRIEADGTFSRPYAFGAGSNSVELRSARGESKRVQFYDSYSGRSRPRLRVVLSWDSDGTDLDLHVISPDGQHTWYGNRVAENGGALDVDVTTGYGPEIYSNPAPIPGTYLVYVNYYGSGSDNSIITTATVNIITDENTPSERQQTFVVPMRKAGDLTLLRSFTMK